MTKNNHHDDCPGCDDKTVLYGVPVHDILTGPTINSCLCGICMASRGGGSSPVSTSSVFAKLVKNAKRSILERGGKHYERLDIEYHDGGYAFTEKEITLPIVHIHAEPGNVACKCKHSFLARGCTCGAIVPYANMKLISK